MELHQLEYFVAVAEEASFTRAASRVHVAQPGVSAQVRRLESELGQQLLDRSGRSVRLTEVGSAVLPFARAALDAVANARLAVDDLAGLVRGQVTAGMVSGCALPVLAELLAGFHDRHPGVAIALVEDNSDRLVERLRDGRLDLALIGWAGETPADIDTVVLADEELVAAVAPGHPLAGACAAAGFTPRIVFEASALPMVVELAGRGLGLAVVPASIPNGPGILRIADPQLRSRLELAWHSAPSANPAARALIEQARALGPPGRPASSAADPMGRGPDSPL
jgi:DNA-binding transcriptional LysR family regulator